MSGAGSVELGERPRLFCALRLPDEVVGALLEWQRRHIVGGRPVPRENLHITLAFLGSQPREKLGGIIEALTGAAQAAERPTFRIGKYRETPRVGMLNVHEQRVSHATSFAYDLQHRLEEIGAYRPERRPWKAHVTVVRFQERLGLRPPLPEIGEFSPSDAAVYLSRLRPSGAEYVVLESVELGGK